MTITSASPLQTRALGLKLAKKTKSGAVFALIGDLGGGKTELTKGLAKGLGVHRLISSPTFILMKVYRLTKGPIRYFCHVDLYRLRGNQDLDEVGLWEFMGRRDTVIVIEWADKIKKLLYHYKKTTVHFSFIDKRARLITITKK